MPVRDTHHETLKKALIKSGWMITHDPYRISWGRKDLYIDLGAEYIFTAERGGKKEEVYRDTFQEPLGQLLLEDYQVNLLVFDYDQEVIVLWIP